MKFTERQLKIMQQAVGYAVMYVKTESETAEFALLKLDIDGMLLHAEEVKKHEEDHGKMKCPFRYCASNPKCEGICRHA